DEVASLEKIFSIEKIDQVAHWTSLQAKPTEAKTAEIEKIKSSIREDDLVSIIYTSGTTGHPKGVMLSHKNIVSNIKSIIPLIPINHEKKALSFLPISHIFERMINYTYMATGASVHYAEKTDKIVENLNEIKAHYFATVPKLLEQMYDSILDTAAQKGVLQKRIISWAINLAMNYQEYKKRSVFEWIQHRVADILVYRKWRNLLGGNVEGIIVGAAALRPELGRLFSAAGIHTREGYGLTETSPVLSVNRFEPGGFRFGTVGIAVPGVEIKIENQNEEGEGEIVVRGPNIMMGYYLLPEETKKVLDQDAWFNTGDIGKIVHKHFLQITDRKKDIFKTSSGKYIAPQVLENKLRTSHYILQSMIIGFNRPFVTALIVPNFAALKIWCKTNGVHWTAPQFMVINPKVMELMTKIIEEINQDLTHHKKIKNFHLLHEEWSVETQEFTPTQKIKRAYLLKKFEKEIKAMYL
ncbi:MAG TPA: long-chain fatty acid--CoA ligase, partial [Bacteroidetes bacterium]|nr:long-chain fatty acid--CoA ligase [Bacteroidota bacterium]